MRSHCKMNAVLLFCLLTGLKAVYSQDETYIPMIEDTETTITYHTMKIPAQSFFAHSSEGGRHKFVRDPASQQLPTISFNNGDLQHIIEEMHLSPKQQREDDEDDYNPQIILFSISPSDEDLGQAMKKNRHVETRLPLFIKQIPILQAPPQNVVPQAFSQKFIPQAPSQRKAVFESPLQAQDKLKSLPSKPYESTSKIVKQERLPNYEPVRSHTPTPEDLGWSNLIRDDKNEKEHDANEMISDLFNEFLKQFTKKQSSSESSRDDSIEEEKLPKAVSSFKNAESSFDGLRSLLGENPESTSSNAAQNEQKIEPGLVPQRATVVPPVPRQIVLPTSSNVLPRPATQSAVRSPAKNVIYLDSMPLELMKFIEAVGNDRGLPQNSGYESFSM